MSKFFAIVIFALSFSVIHRAAAQNWLWAAAGTGNARGGYGLKVGSAGNVYTIGAGKDTAYRLDTTILHNKQADGLPGKSAIIAKFDTGGKVLWAKNTLHSIAGPCSIALNKYLYFLGWYADSSVTIDSTTLLNPAGVAPQYFVARMTTNGAVIWMKNVGAVGPYPALTAITGAIAAKNDNAYVACSFSGRTEHTGSFTVANTDTTGLTTDLFVAKLDTNGNTVWAESGGGGNNDVPAGIAIGPSGMVYVAGTTASRVFNVGIASAINTGAGSIFIAALNDTGGAKWLRTAGGNAETVGGLVADQYNNAFITGTYYNNAFVVGSSLLPPGPDSSSNVYLAKFDSAGNSAWAIAANGNGAQGHSVTTDPCGNIWISGSMGIDDLDLGDTAIFLPPVAVDPVFIAAFNEAGQLVGQAALPSGGSAKTSIAAGINGYMFVSGSYTINPLGVGRTVLFDTSREAGLEDMYVAKYLPGRYYDTTFLESGYCSYDSVVLTAPAGFASYLWSTGSTLATQTARATGTYWVYATGPFCSAGITVDTLVYKNLKFSLGNDTSACQPLWLRVPVPGVNYLWQDSSAQDSFMAQATGQYYVTASFLSCAYTDTINVVIPNVGQNLQDIKVCREQPVNVTLDATVPAGATVYWSTGSTAPSITATDTGRYWVTVTLNGCWGRGDMALTSDFCNCDLFIPNAFTPNDDGVNDYFTPVFTSSCQISSYDFTIYDRWGEKLYHGAYVGDRWDGKRNGAALKPGVYVYLIKYTTASDNKEHTRTGNVTVIR